MILLCTWDNALFLLMLSHFASTLDTPAEGTHLISLTTTVIFISNPCIFCRWFRSSGLNCTGCPNKHGNSVTNSISSILWISIVIPNFKSHNITTSARVYFMKRVNGCKNVSIMSPQNEQWRRVSLLCLYTVIFLFY